MQGFELDQLRTLVAVADAGSLTAAAPRVFLSQSAVSEQMRKLEEASGQVLLLRSKSGVVPTAAGTRLLGHARQILVLSEQAWREMHHQVLQGELHLAVTDYFKPGALTRLLARLGAQYPQMRLHVSVLKSGAIEQAWTRGDFDLALTMRIHGPQTETGAVWRTEALVWAAQPGKRLTAGEPVPLVVLPDSCALHQFTLRWLRAQHVPLVVAHVASGVAGLQSALAAGLGVACINTSALGEGVSRLAAPHHLPPLPSVSFDFLPPRSPESPMMTQMRGLLAQHLDG